MDERAAFVAGVAVGALSMYMLDPRGGGRRRALVRDQMVHLAHEAEDTLEARADDLTNRARGAVMEAKSALRDEPVSDRVLAERVRAAIGTAVSRPGSIEVEARNGLVTLRGPVLRHEMEGLLARVRGVNGVSVVESRLDVHEYSEGVPGLQMG
jgi:osmotically-inducible protein OsmY